MKIESLNAATALARQLAYVNANIAEIEAIIRFMDSDDKSKEVCIDIRLFDSKAKASCRNLKEIPAVKNSLLISSLSETSTREDPAITTLVFTPPLSQECERCLM